MKHAFKFGFFALALSLSVVACNSNKPAEDATDSVAMDSVVTDSVAVDTTVVDSTTVDTAAAEVEHTH